MDYLKLKDAIVQGHEGIKEVDNGMGRGQWDKEDFTEEELSEIADNIISNYTYSIETNPIDIQDSLAFGKFTIHKPKEWEQDRIQVEISDYDHDSTTINVTELTLLRDYIDSIINIKKQ